MSIRYKVFGSIFFAFILLFVGFFLVTSLIIMVGYREVENNQAASNTKRVKETLDESLSSLSDKSADWANWDDTYEYIQNKNTGYEISNFQYKTMQKINVDIMLFYDKQGKLVYGFDLHGKTGKLEPPSIGLLEHFESHKSRIIPSDQWNEQKGYLVIPETVFMISIRPILKSTGEGPAQGTLIFGRYIDAVLIQHLQDITHVSFELITLAKDTAQTEALLGLTPDTISESEVFIYEQSQTEIQGFLKIRDIHDDPILVLSVTTPRDVSAVGSRSMTIFGWFIVLSFLASGVLVYVVLNRTAIKKIIFFTQSVEAIGKTKELTSRLTIQGDDELAVLATSINGLLDEIEKMRSDESENIKMREEEMKKHTEEMKKHTEELEQTNTLMVGRELKMVELKKELEELRQKAVK